MIDERKEQFINSIHNLYTECLRIISEKNNDYSNDDPFGNFRMAESIGVSVEQGIMVRCMDKFSRLSNILSNKEMMVDEKLEDTIMDLINYLAIMYAYVSTKE